MKHIKYIFILIFGLKIVFAQENSADTPTAKSRKATGGPHLKIELLKQEATADTPNSRARKMLTIDTSASVSKDAPKTDDSAKGKEDILFSARGKGSAFIPTTTNRTGRTSAPPVPNTPRPRRVSSTSKGPDQQTSSVHTGSATKLDRKTSASNTVSPEQARHLSVTGLNGQRNPGKLSEDFGNTIAASPREANFYDDPSELSESGASSGRSSSGGASLPLLDRKTSASKSSPDNPRGSHSRNPSGAVAGLNKLMDDRSEANLSADLPNSNRINEGNEQDDDADTQQMREKLGFNTTTNDKDQKTKLEPKDSKKIIILFLSAFVLSFSVLYKYNKSFNQKINNFLRKIKLKIRNWVCEEPKDNNQDNKPEKDKDKDKNNTNQKNSGNSKK